MRWGGFYGAGAMALAAGSQGASGGSPEPGPGTITLSSPRIDASGSFLIFAVSGGVWTDVAGISVDPSGVTLSAQVASVDAAGVTNTATINVPVGLRAEFIGGELYLWIEGAIHANYSAVTVQLASAAVVAGPDISIALASTAVTNNNVLFASGLPAAHIHSIAESRTVINVEHGVVRGAWRAEAAAIHAGGIAGVEWTITKPGQSAVVTWQGEERGSWYQDTEVLTNAQWDANAALRGAEAGLGVWPSPAGNAATDPTGAVTITALIVPKVGGRTMARTISWTIYSAQAGAYPDRNIWLDTVSGSDANDGLSIGAPKLTLAAAVNAAGSVNGGATQTTVPWVNIIGGTSGSPRDIEMNGMPTTGAGNAIPSATDTYLRLRPAAGYARDTIRLINHAGVSTGVGQRVRRLAVHDLTIDISDGPSGTSSKTLLGGNTTSYPPATNPQSFWFHNVTWTHRAGKIGQLSEGNSGNFLSTAFGKLNKAFWTNWTHTNTGQRGIQSNTLNIMRNVRFFSIQKDVLKAPDCVFGFYAEDNAVDPRLLPITALTGTINPGDTVTGVISWPATETVESYTGGVVRLTPGGNSYSFKSDDAKTHVAVTITSEVGTIAVGEEVRNPANTIRFRVYRRDGNILRGIYTLGSGFTNGLALTGLTSGATCTISAIANAQKNLFFSGGATATAAPPHPDGLQVQNFYPTRAVLTGVTGTFQVGEVVTCPGVSNNGTITAISGAQLDFSGTPLWETRTSSVITGQTSGATGTISIVYAINNDADLVLANGRMRRMDGQLLFGENGGANIGIWNVLGLKLDVDSALVSQFGNNPALTIAHCTIPTQNLRLPIVSAQAKVGGHPPGGQAFVHNIFRIGTADYVPAGLSASAISRGRPGVRWRNHLTQPSGVEGSGQRTADAYCSKGNPAFANGLAWDESDTLATLAKDDFRPTAGVPAATAVTPANRLARFDLRGVERAASDWPGAVGVTA